MTVAWLLSCFSLCLSELVVPLSVEPSGTRQLSLQYCSCWAANQAELNLSEPFLSLLLWPLRPGVWSLVLASIKPHKPSEPLPPKLPLTHASGRRRTMASLASPASLQFPLCLPCSLSRDLCRHRNSRGLAVQPRLALNSWSSHLSLLSDGTTDMTPPRQRLFPSREELWKVVSEPRVL